METPSHPITADSLFQDKTKRLNLSLVGIDGNVYSVIAHFQQCAKEQGWSREEIAAVRSRCFSSHSYDEVLRVVMSFSKTEGA